MLGCTKSKLLKFVLDDGTDTDRVISDSPYYNWTGGGKTLIAIQISAQSHDGY